MLKNIFSQLKQLSFFSLAFLFAFVVFMGIAIVYAWTEPSSAPPAGNVAAPVNVGSATQYKSGALGVGGVFEAYSTAIFDGNVGIGTTGPTALLEIGTGGSKQGYIRLQDVANANRESNIYVDSGGGLHFDTSSNGYPIRLDGSKVILGMTGNVGIGTTSPGAKLDIQTSNGSDAFKINTYKMVPISSTELGVYDSNNNQVLIFDQGN